MDRPAESIERPPVLLRRWRQSDLYRAHHVVTESLPHLRPWMAWAVGEYTLDTMARFLDDSDRKWRDGAEFGYAITVGGAIVGCISLMDRVGPGGLEIGYWLHPAHTGRGLVTTAAAALVEQAFALPGVEHVEIWHDAANTASGGVPHRLGFTEVERRSPPRETPLTSGECGVDVVWRLTRRQHAAAGS
ncbi:GNAT family N-acetyltransferase [Saccharopolyspora rosea]|uniref:GNAT family N-acetyltransferase n=1 Tax=Saccharopolyspora rosea TaxID=524884 RepID=UPI0021DA3D24|nr:GNAT family N-acetyltransferase [Saccharopolyspora rosea]